MQDQKSLSEEEKNTQPLLVFALGFNGCMLTRNSGSADAGLHLKNPGFLDFLKEEATNHHAKKIVITSFAQRQSWLLEKKKKLSKEDHSNSSDSFRSFVEDLSDPTQMTDDSISVVFDDFLLENIFDEANNDHTSTHTSLYLLDSSQPPKRDNNNNEDLRYLLDNNKATLLYMKVHYLATQYENRNIICSFIDGDLEILKKLNTFFKKNTQLIPENITIQFYEYKSQSSEKKAVPKKYSRHIKGKGPIEKKFKTSLQNLSTSMIKELGDEDKQIQLDTRKLLDTHLNNTEMENKTINEGLKKRKEHWEKRRDQIILKKLEKFAPSQSWPYHYSKGQIGLFFVTTAVASTAQALLITRPFDIEFIDALLDMFDFKVVCTSLWASYLILNLLYEGYRLYQLNYSSVEKPRAIVPGVAEKEPDQEQVADQVQVQEPDQVQESDQEQVADQVQEPEQSLATGPGI